MYSSKGMKLRFEIMQMKNISNQTSLKKKKKKKLSSMKKLLREFIFHKFNLMKI